MLLFHDAATFFSSLITSLLRETAIEIDSVTSRVKDREDSIQKFSRKYREDLEDSGTPYEIKAYINDLIGVRLVCLYETDVNVVGDVLRKSFKVIDATDKTRVLEEQHSFGYKGLHLDLLLEADREHLPEYRRYSAIKVEVQIRTISQDAWSTLDHKIKYKKVIPEELKRRINRLAALFELADQEFILIRDAAQVEIRKGEELVNPYTEVRHALVAHDRDTFGSLLFPSQRGTFLEWLASRHDDAEPDR